MGFDRRDIRPEMDVYTLDNTYLGTVRQIISGVEAQDEESVPEAASQSSKVSGEQLGPMPTAIIGNRGPITQSAAQGYAVRADGLQRIGPGALVVGKWHGLKSRRIIPMDAVQTVSLERVVLKMSADELDQIAPLG